MEQDYFIDDLTKKIEVSNEIEGDGLLTSVFKQIV